MSLERVTRRQHLKCIFENFPTIGRLLRQIIIENAHHGDQEIPRRHYHKLSLQVAPENVGLTGGQNILLVNSAICSLVFIGRPPQIGEVNDSAGYP